MRKAQILWLGATMVAIGTLLLTLQTRPERGDTRERFDEAGEARVDAPDAAAHSDLARRQPTDGALDMPRLYEAATRRRHRSRDSRLPLAATFPPPNRRHESGGPVRA